MRKPSMWAGVFASALKQVSQFVYTCMYIQGSQIWRRLAFSNPVTVRQCGCLSSFNSRERRSRYSVVAMRSCYAKRPEAWSAHLSFSRIFRSISTPSRKLEKNRRNLATSCDGSRFFARYEHLHLHPAASAIAGHGPISSTEGGQGGSFGRNVG